MRIALALLLAPMTASADTATAGYLEAFYQAHFQNPSNRVTNLRGFDNRSRTFTLSNVALDVKAERGAITTRIVLQFGTTGETYYSADDADVWKHVQTAMVTARLPHDFTVEAGLVASPVGPEVFAVKDNWNWSRSNLFFGLPFYHAGVHVSRPFADGWTAKLHAYNGWNNVVDNNLYPSVGLSASYASVETTAQILYLGGIEREEDWRHLVDVIVQRKLTDELAIAAQADAGFERTAFGTSSWLAGAVYAKVTFEKWLYAAARADYFREHVADGAAPIFWPTRWLASGTATLAYQPVDGASLRLEYRHDHAADDVYFGGDVALDPTTMQAITNRRTQDTVTLGITAWF